MWLDAHCGALIGFAAFATLRSVAHASVSNGGLNRPLLVFASRQDVDHLFGRHQIYASCRVSIIEPPLEVAP